MHYHLINNSFMTLVVIEELGFNHPDNIYSIKENCTMTDFEYHILSIPLYMYDTIYYYSYIAIQVSWSQLQVYQKCILRIFDYIPVTSLN